MKQTKHQQQKHLNNNNNNNRKKEMRYVFLIPTQQTKRKKRLKRPPHQPDASITPADVFGVHGFLVQVSGWAALLNEDDKVAPNQKIFSQNREVT